MTPEEAFDVFAYLQQRRMDAAMHAIMSDRVPVFKMTAAEIKAAGVAAIRQCVRDEARDLVEALEASLEITDGPNEVHPVYARMAHKAIDAWRKKYAEEN